MLCPSCGQETGTDTKFCRQCGTALQPGGSSSAGQPETDAIPEPPRASNINRTPLIAGAAIVLIVGVVIAFLAMAGGGDDPESPPTGPDASPTQPAATATSDPEPAIALNPARADDFAHAILISEDVLPGSGWISEDDTVGNDDPFGYEACAAMDAWSLLTADFDDGRLAGEANREISRAAPRSASRDIRTQVDLEVAIYDSADGIEPLITQFGELGSSGAVVDCFEAAYRSEVSDGSRVFSATPFGITPDEGEATAYVAIVPIDSGSLTIYTEIHFWTSSNVTMGIFFQGLASEINSQLVTSVLSEASTSLDDVIADPGSVSSEPPGDPRANQQFMLGLCVATTAWEARILTLEFDEEAISLGTEEAQAEFREKFGEFVGWTKDYRLAIDSLPPPDFPDGAAFQARYVELLENMELVLGDVISDINELDLNDVDAFVAGLESALRDLEVTADSLGEAFDSASSNYKIEALDDLAESIPECENLDLMVDAAPEPDPSPVPGADADGDNIVDSLDACPLEAETINRVIDTDGCPDTIDDLAQAARLQLDDYWGMQFDGADVGYRTARVFESYSGSIDTPCGTLEPGNAFYCPPSHGVYYDLALLEEQLERVGDFAPVFIIAHEWGHLVQGLVGSLGDHPSIVNELQADCLAGVFTAHAINEGYLEVDDMLQAAASLFLFGDRGVPVLDPEAHGSPGRRIDAFDIGIRGLVCSPEAIEGLVR